MDKAEIKFEIIKECLHKIISYTLLLGTLDILLFLCLLQKTDSFSIGQYTIPSKHIAIFSLSLIIFLIINLIHKLDRINSIYKSIADIEEKNSIKIYLNLFPSILNPYSENNKSGRDLLFDYIGLSIQTFLYLIGVELTLNFLISRIE